jgi:large subunit ribosomal protein L13
MTVQTTKNDLNKTLWVKKDYLEKNRKRYKVDASGKTLGRLAVEIAIKLTGKDKAWYNDFWDA